MVATSKSLDDLRLEEIPPNDEQAQKRHAAELSELLHEEGAKRFELDWLRVHNAICFVADEGYVPSTPTGSIDIRFVAVLADAAFRLLEKYELKPRSGSKTSWKHNGD